MSPFWAWGEREPVEAAEGGSLPSSPLTRQIYTGADLYAGCHTCACTHIGPTQAGGPRSCHSPVETGLGHLLCQVWARARQIFLHHGKTVLHLVFLVSSQETWAPPQRPGGVRMSPKAQLSKFAILKGDPEWGAGCSLDVPRPTEGEDISRVPRESSGGSLHTCLLATVSSPHWWSWGRIPNRMKRYYLLVVFFWVVTMHSRLRVGPPNQPTQPSASTQNPVQPRNTANPVPKAWHPC